MYEKVGDAALKGAKYAWEGLKSVDYGKLWSDTKEIASTVAKANEKEAATKK